VTLAVFHPDFVRRDREPCDGASALRLEEFGIASEVADERYLGSPAACTRCLGAYSNGRQRAAASHQVRRPAART